MSRRPTAAAIVGWLVTSSGLATAAPAAAQILGQAPSFDIPLWRVLASLGLCIVLAAAGGLALKFRMSQGAGSMKTQRRSVKAGAFGLKASGLNQGRRVRLIENMRVSPQLEICLLNFDGRHFLVAASLNSVVVLDRGESGGSAPSEAEA